MNRDIDEHTQIPIEMNLLPFQEHWKDFDSIVHEVCVECKLFQSKLYLGIHFHVKVSPKFVGILEVETDLFVSFHPGAACIAALVRLGEHLRSAYVPGLGGGR